MILGIDVGGTFTDLVFLDDAGRVRIHKLLTSARDPSIAILQGIADIGATPDAAVVHGATVATNALLERRGARTAFVATAGFGDVLDIGRQARPELYALHPTRPEPLVPPERRFELPERVAPRREAGGGALVLQPLQAEAVDSLVARLAADGIESVAVCLLFSFLHPAHEQQVRDRIAALGEAAPSVSLSSEVLPEYREYERAVTTAVNAYVAPLMGRYLANLERGLGGRRLRIMQSNGGSISAEAARTLAARTALSGPAGGVVGAFAAAQGAGLDQVITFDMGGTSTDVSLCPGRIQETAEGSIAGLPFGLPTIDIHTIGAGGGSIARLDAGGALRVGPESAGSDPGPVCYGRSHAAEITVTDANLVLGRLDPHRFLGGKMTLDLDRARAHLQRLAARLGLSAEEAAWGVIRVANSNMERAIRTISVERGYDPRGFALVVFGGAGPLHACELAAALRIPRVLFPPHPGVLSALGMVLADVVKDYSRTVMLPARDAAPGVLEGLFAPLADRARAELRAEGLAADEMALFPAVDMRYVGQSYELAVPVAQAPQTAPALDVALLERDFHRAHRRRFSHADEAEPVEIVNVRLKAVGRTAKPCPSRLAAGGADPAAARVGTGRVHFAAAGDARSARPADAALYERARLQAANVLAGPAVVTQLDTTIVLPPGWTAVVDDWGNLMATGESAAP